MQFASLLKVAAVLAISGGAAVFVLTMPSRIAGDALMSRTAILRTARPCSTLAGASRAKERRNRKTAPGLVGVSRWQHLWHSGTPISRRIQKCIRAWSELEFVDAMKRGVGRNGEHLYPAFPFTSYQRMRLDDVRDLYAYLKTFPAIATPSERHQLSFPFNVRRGLGLWKLLHVDGKTFVPDSSKDDVFNRALSRGRSRPLRRMPQLPQPDRRNRPAAPLRWRGRRGWEGLGAQHHTPRRRHR